MSEDTIMLIVFGITVLVILALVILADTEPYEELDIDDEYPQGDYKITFKDDP